MKPVMYIFANRGLGMSPGKLAAQVAHAAVHSHHSQMTIAAEKPGRSEHNLMKAWFDQGYPKIVMLAEDTEQLHHIERYLNDRGYRTDLIIDEGRTEIKAFTPTALGVELVDKDRPEVLAHFGHFKTYRDLPRPLDLQAAYNAVAAHGHLNWRGREFRKDGLPIKIRNDELRSIGT